MTKVSEQRMKLRIEYSRETDLTFSDNIPSYADWLEKKLALSQHFSGSLLVEIKTLLEQYRDEEMPDWNTPYHYDAEGWAAMKYFIQWLERKSNDR